MLYIFVPLQCYIHECICILSFIIFISDVRFRWRAWKIALCLVVRIHWRTSMGVLRTLPLRSYEQQPTQAERRICGVSALCSTQCLLAGQYRSKRTIQTSEWFYNIFWVFFFQLEKTVKIGPTSFRGILITSIKITLL